MSDLIEKIRRAQIHAGEQVVVDDLRRRGLAAEVGCAVVSLADHRKANMPQAGSCLSEPSELLKALIEALEAKGTDVLVACCDGWDVRLAKGKPEGPQ